MFLKVLQTVLIFWGSVFFTFTRLKITIHAVIKKYFCNVHKKLTPHHNLSNYRTKNRKESFKNVWDNTKFRLISWKDVEKRYIKNSLNHLKL